MSEAIAVAIISGVLTLAGVVVTVIFGNKKTNETVKQSHELTLYRLDKIEEKQDKHNAVIERTYQLEKDMAVVKEQITELQKGE